MFAHGKAREDFKNATLNAIFHFFEKEPIEKRRKRGKVGHKQGKAQSCLNLLPIH
jgi:hypothetical protein